MKILEPTDNEVYRLGLGWLLREPPPGNLIEALNFYAKAQMPEEGVRYEPSVFFGSDIHDYIRYLEDAVFGVLCKVQIGVYLGEYFTIATSETHGFREVVIAATEMWLALVPNLAAKIEMARAETGTIEGAIKRDDFFIVHLETNQGFVVGAETGHYAPNAPHVPVVKKFVAGIILPAGTNSPAITIPSHMLMAIGKFGVTSPGTPEAGRGWPIAVDGPFEFPASLT